MDVGSKMLKWLVGFIVLALIVVSGCLLSTGDVTGALAEGERLRRMKASPQWSTEEERFTNFQERVDGSLIEMTGKFIFGGSDYREPEEVPPTLKRQAQDFVDNPTSGLRITWFGHSSFLVELDGTRTLVDPVWGERASPFSWTGPKRFYEPPVSLKELPPLDLVLISHDHYDHLDRDTVASLASLSVQWVVPIGVGAHLEYWGVKPEKIVELDWWENHQVGEVTITATPSRHFSGRSLSLGDQNTTLWAGWSWQGLSQRVFYSGDTALHNQFEEIGDRLGPFDVTLMEVGAYSDLWTDVHLGPEQAVIAHQLVKGGILIPVHWGLFDLALHGWTEPVERVIQAAKALQVDVAIVRPGGSFDIQQAPSIDRWWPEVPWDSVEITPVWSTQVKHLQSFYK